MRFGARQLVTSFVVVAALGSALPASAATPDRRLPPSTYEELTEIFEGKVRDLGFTTTRALLQNLDTYARDPNGVHLAIYLEPIDTEFTDAEYVARFADVARVFLPLVYKRWKGLKSFDVCLEPLQSEDGSEAPPPITQLIVTRRGVRTLNWRKATLAEILVAADKYRATEEADADVYVYFDDRLDTVPELMQARTESAQR